MQHGTAYGDRRGSRVDQRNLNLSYSFKRPLSENSSECVLPSRWQHPSLWRSSRIEVVSRTVSLKWQGVGYADKVPNRTRMSIGYEQERLRIVQGCIVWGNLWVVRLRSVPEWRRSLERVRCLDSESSKISGCSIPRYPGLWVEFQNTWYSHVRLFRFIDLGDTTSLCVSETAISCRFRNIHHLP